MNADRENITSLNTISSVFLNEEHIMNALVFLNAEHVMLSMQEMQEQNLAGHSFIHSFIEFIQCLRRRAEVDYARVRARLCMFSTCVTRARYTAQGLAGRARMRGGCCPHRPLTDTHFPLSPPSLVAGG